MPRVLRMPDISVLPAGPARAFVELLFDYRHAASYPKIKVICEKIKEVPEDQRNGTASRETVRKMFRGHVPQDWGTVEVVFLALCYLADLDPDRKGRYWDGEDQVDTDRRSQMRETWSAALYGRPADGPAFQGVDFSYEEVAPHSDSGFNSDPWAPSGFIDEAPF